MFKVGDVVRVKDGVVGSELPDVNREWTELGGWIWVVTSINRVHDTRVHIYTTSLATGVWRDADGEDIYWFPDELEKADV